MLYTKVVWHGIVYGRKRVKSRLVDKLDTLVCHRKSFFFRHHPCVLLTELTLYPDTWKGIANKITRQSALCKKKPIRSSSRPSKAPLYAVETYYDNIKYKLGREMLSFLTISKEDKRQRSSPLWSDRNLCFHVHLDKMHFFPVPFRVKNGGYLTEKIEIF